MTMETNDILKEILKWQKIQGIQAFKAQVGLLLDTKEKKQVFELTDGTMSVKQISEKAKVATGTVSNWWNKWLAEGILVREGARYTKVASIEGLFTDSKKDGK